MDHPEGTLIYSPRDYLDEGLFGRVFLWVLEVLPHLHARRIFPAWHITSPIYGRPGDHRVIPGVLDLAYEPPEHPRRRISLISLRDSHCRHLGPEWAAASRLWSQYFRIPFRITATADATPLPPGTLGLHYRGTDKLTAAWDSNPVTEDDFVALALDFLRSNVHLRHIFLATDAAGVFDRLRHAVELPVTHLGAGQHHKSVEGDPSSGPAMADEALRDCLLLSRCDSVLLTSSALSAFAKILNPDLKIFRCAASKALWYGPYYPVAHIPAMPVASPSAAVIMSRTMVGDWTLGADARRYSSPFLSRPNWPWRLKALDRRLRRLARRLLGRPQPPVHPYFG